MLRKAIIQIGEFIERVLTLKTLLAVYGVAGGINIVIDSVGSSKSPFQIALDTFITFCWMLLFFVLSFLVVKALSKSLIWLGNYYPNWYYFPKLELSFVKTSENEIELHAINSKANQKITLRVAYYSVYQAKSPPRVAGVAPLEVKELLPLAPMTGKDARTKIIGSITERGVTLSTGNKSEKIELTQPGFYYYEVSLDGEFRGREYGGGGKIPIKIKENHEVEC